MSYFDTNFDCFFSAFPSACLSFQGPHEVECLQGMWQKSGCVVEGRLYPTVLNEDQYRQLEQFSLQ